MCRARRVATILAAGDLLLLTALYGLFVFTDRVPVAGWLALGLLAILRWWATGRFTLMTPLTLPILIILLMLPVTLYASVDWTLSLPKVYGLVLSVAAFYIVVNRLHTVQDAWGAVFALVLSGLAVVALGVAGADWLTSKLFALPQVYEQLPRLIRGIPRSIRGGFSANGVGGTLIFFIPLLVSLLGVRQESESGDSVGAGWGLRLWWRWHRPLVLLALALALATLVLTQSRGSFVGLAVGLLALAVWRERRLLWLLPLVALALAAVILTGRAESLMEFLFRVDSLAGNASVSMQGRFEVWQRALYMIQDFPFTGIGIGTFDRVVHVLYPLFLIGPDAQVAHAHNELLQVAVDMGLPTLVAYIALLSACFIAAWRTYRLLPPSGLRAATMGLACGMLAHQVFGITDAFLLGTKPGVVMWVFLAVVAGLYRQLYTSAPPHLRTSAPQPLCSEGLASWLRHLLAFGYWILFSLLSIAFIGNRPYIGLAIGLAGGVALGFLSLASYEPRRRRERVVEEPA
ncbi:MAG: O-antigen ligase family protein [Anaerolineae bacterium]|nr:O-antigen ligase family protein [Anaerolineae bacterium]